MVYFDKFIRAGLNRGGKDNDTALAYKIIDSLRQYAQSQQNEELDQDAILLKAFYMGWLTPHNERARQMIIQVKKNAADQNNVYLQLRAANLLGRYYYENQQYSLAFEAYLEQWPLLGKISDTDFPDKRNNIYSIGNLYYDFGDYRQTIYYLRQAMAVSTKDISGTKFTITNTLGLCYGHLGMPDSSDYYFRTLLEMSDCPPVWQAVVKGNLGENYFKRQQYELAKPLLKEGVKLADSLRERGLQSHAAMLLADIAFREGNLADAKKYTLQAQAVLEQTKRGTQHSYEAYYRFRDLYFLLARLYTAEGNLQLSIVYTDSAVAAKDSVARQYNSLKQLRAQQTMDLQRHNAQLNQLRQKKITERNIMLIVVSGLVFTAIFFYSSQRRRHNIQQLQSQLVLQKNQQELASATLLLDEFTQNMAEKNQQLQTLEAKIDNSNTEAIVQLRSISILSNEEWERFRILFEQVHVGYLQNLRHKYPAISPAELRFMALARLNFSNKEMAASLGVSSDAVRVVWYRLRKKLDLPENTNLEQFVQGV